MPTLEARPNTIHWGYFDARLKPVLEIESGERVTIRTLSGGPEALPREPGFEIPPELLEVHAQASRHPLAGPHLLTGPIAVRGALPGDVLEVRILEVRLRTDWAWNLVRPLGGALPEEFPDTRLLHIRLDRERMLGYPPWGGALPLQPFFGIMGVAPPPHWGAITSIVPRAHGGNLDIKELGAGATLYLPVFNEGALFSAGDGHAVQGDGEVCLTAAETSLDGVFSLTVRRDLKLAMPRAETPTHWIGVGIDPDLDLAAKQALRETIALICERTRLTREEAYRLCSLQCDLRVSQLVNQHKGVHAMLPKAALAGLA